MIFPPPLELSLLGIYEAGVPNRERILLRPTESINLAQFGVLVGVKLPNNNVVPVWDNFFWFGEVQAPAPSWIILLTGQGKFEVSKHPENGQPAFVFYWGRKATIFNTPEIVPVIFQINAILIGGSVPQKPQLPSGQSSP